MVKPTGKEFVELNEELLATENEQELEAILKRESKGKNRPSYLRRITARLTRIHAMNFRKRKEEAVR